MENTGACATKHLYEDSGKHALIMIALSVMVRTNCMLLNNMVFIIGMTLQYISFEIYYH